MNDLLGIVLKFHISKKSVLKNEKFASRNHQNSPEIHFSWGCAPHHVGPLFTLLLAHSNPALRNAHWQCNCWNKFCRYAHKACKRSKPERSYALVAYRFNLFQHQRKRRPNVLRAEVRSKHNGVLPQKLGIPGSRVTGQNLDIV